MYWNMPDQWGSVLGEVDRLRRGLDRLMAGAPRWAQAPYPAVNLWTDEDKLGLTAELPGFATKDIDVAVHGRTLTLSGSVKQKEPEEKHKYHRRERERTGFHRTIELPHEVDADKVEAKLEKGILAVVLPRAEQDKPKRISVKARD